MPNGGLGVNKDWFFKKLEERGKSLRGLARHMGLDASAVSRTLSGQRRLHINEANDMAVFLGVSADEVLYHAGASIQGGLPSSSIFLTAVVNEKGVIGKIDNPVPLPAATMERAQAALAAHKEDDGEIIAAQVRALSGPLAAMDDAIMLYRRAEAIEPAAITALSACKTKDGEEFLARVERSRITGEARIICVTGEAMDVELIAASPILAMIQ